MDVPILLIKDMDVPILLRDILSRWRTIDHAKKPHLVSGAFVYYFETYLVARLQLQDVDVPILFLHMLVLVASQIHNLPISSRHATVVHATLLTQSLNWRWKYDVLIANPILLALFTMT